MSRWGRALDMFRATTAAVPPGAARPSMTLWLDPGGGLPPVSWAPHSGEFQTHWDWPYWSALAIPAYWQGRMLISQAIGGMPLTAHRELEVLFPNPTVLREPNPGEDRCNTVAAWVADLIDHGNAVGVITAVNAEGKATAIQPVRAIDAEVGRNSDTGRVYYKIGEQVFDASSMFHAKGVHQPGDLRGIGVLEAGLSTLDRVQVEQTYAHNAFRSGVPSGLLRVKDPDLQAGSDDDEPGYTTAKGIKKAWQQSVGTGDVAVLSELVDFTPLSWTPSDAQMVEARSMSVSDVASLLNLDGYWLGAARDSKTYQNVQQAALQLSRFTLGFWITALESQFSRLLPYGTRAVFERDTILRDDMTTRVTNWINMINAGVMTVDEVRHLQGLPPIESGQLPGDDTTTEDASVTRLFPDGTQSDEAVS